MEAARAVPLNPNDDERAQDKCLGLDTNLRQRGAGKMSRISSLFLSLFFITFASILLRQTLYGFADARATSTFVDAAPTFVVIAIIAGLAILLFRYERGHAAGRLFARFNRVCLAAAIACYGIVACATVFSVIKAA